MPAQKKKFQGVYPAFYACYDPQGAVDPAASRRLARWLVERGVDGLYLTGSSGDSIFQTAAERKKIVEAVIEEVGHRVPIIVHAGAPTTLESTELAAHASQAGADAIAAISNVYYQLPESCIESHWLQMIEAAGLPFFIYNIPSTTGYRLSLQLFRKMAARASVIGIKNSSDSCADITRWRQNSPDDFVIFNGADEQYLAGRVLGSNGGIGGTYACMPELFVALEQAFQSGDLPAAMLWQERINRVITDLTRFSQTTVVSAAKAVLQARGVDTGGVRAPMVRVAADDPEIIRIAHRIEGWL